ncbi:MAG: serine/threonine-protein kinase [Myxococcota bacterium]
MDNEDPIGQREDGVDRPATITDGDTGSGDDGGTPPLQIGRFTVVARVGSGGMGAVYEAHDPQLDRNVALKVLHAPRRDSSHHTQARARLLREAQAIAKVQHPNVVHVYEVGVVNLEDDERIFLAMELVAGGDMRAWMKRLHETEDWKRGRAWRDVVQVIIQAARGLAAAHAVGLMHRDFKPDNILVGEDGLVRVVDFGLARRVREQEVVTERAVDIDAFTKSGRLDERLTVTGAVLGTPAYMAPEQFSGDQTDERTDQFALCLTLYEALYGVRAFHSDSAEGLACAVMMGELRAWPTEPVAPAHLVRILERGLSRDPDDRFETIDDVIEALSIDPERDRRRRWAWAGGGVALVAATGLGAFVSRQDSVAAADPCAAGAQRAAAHWDASRAASLRAALDEPELPYAAKTIDALVIGIDAYVARWATAHRDACEATHVRREQTGDLLDRRMACLDRRLTSVSATVDELVREDAPSVLGDALRVVNRLPAIEDCADVHALQGVASPPAEARDAVASIAEQIGIASAKTTVLRHQEALELLSGLGERVDEVGYEPLQAEFLLALASAQERTDKLDPSIKTARRALLVAQAAGHDAVVRDTAALLASLYGIRKADSEAGIQWADFAEATAERVGWTDAKRARLLQSRAWLLVEWGLSREAIDVGEAALAAAARAHGPESWPVASVHSSLGSIYGRLRDMPKAEAHFRRDIELSEELLGEDHPTLIGAYLNLGNTLSAQRRLDEARAAFDRSIALADALPNIPLATRARTQASLGNLLVNERRWEAALGPLQRALELREEVYGPDHPLVARTLLSLGNAYTNMGRVPEATEAYAQSLAIKEKAHGAEAPNLIEVLDNLGMHHVRHGEAALGVPYLRRADAILDANPMDPYRHADHGFWYGRALVEAEVDVAGGSAMVDKAIADLVKMGNEGLLNDARDWRAEHPG